MWNMFRVVFRVALVIAALTSYPSAASTLSDFAGRWAVTSNDRNIIVVDLVYDKDKESIVGTISRPTSIKIITTPLRFSAIKGPISETALEELHFDQNRLHFVATSPSDAKLRIAYEMTLSGQGQSQLEIVGAPIAPWPLIRVDPAAMLVSNWDEEKTYTIDDHLASNPEMATLFNEDQSDRSNGITIDWNSVGKADAARREATRKMLTDGSLHTGVDFQRAAYIFQHGDRPDDFLLAHTLATLAVAKGKYDALWIATASLDRYLQSIGRAQIYGTQFDSRPGKTFTQTPYDSTLISDALRQQLGVPTVAQQEEQRKFQESQRH
jgi:hypothetical protein